MGLKLKVNISLDEKVLEEVSQKLNDKVAALYAAVVPRTPVSRSRKGVRGTKKGHTGGHLRRNWGIIPAEIDGNSVVAFLYNNAHYAGHVNFGHRTRLGKGKAEKYKPKKDGKSYVKGQHFLEKALGDVGLDPTQLNPNYKK